MALPRTIIRLLRPYVIVLVAILIYVAYQHYHKVENEVITQSHANLRTATKLIQGQLNTSLSSIASLNKTLSIKDTKEANQLAIELIYSTENYNDILRYNHKNHTAFSETDIDVAKHNNSHPKRIDLTALTWTDMNFMHNNYQVSNLYQSRNKRWVIAVREKHPKQVEQYVIEFDLWYMSQSLIDLQTMSSGNVFVVDRTTGQIILHPNPDRIGKSASVYRYAVAGKVIQDDRSTPVSYYFAGKPTYKFDTKDNIVNSHPSGEVTYFFKNDPKLAVYNARNSLNWIYFSSTSRSTLFSHSYSLLLVAVLAATLLLVVFVFNFINKELQLELTKLARSTNLFEFRNQVNVLLSRFCSHNRIQLCLYNHDSHTFYSIGYSGEEHAISVDKDYAINLLSSDVTYIRHSKDDLLANQVQIDKHFYRLPLQGYNGLFGVIFVESRTRTYGSLMKLLQTYIETALSNVLFHRQLSLRDSATNQDNLFTLRNKINRYKDHKDVYLLTMDVDDLKVINYQYGYTCGDQLILEMTDIVNTHFPIASTLSTARVSGDEFCVLYHADDQQMAYALADDLRDAIQTHRFKFDRTDIHFTVSIGISQLQSSVDKTLAASLQATDRSKKKGKNLTIMNVTI
ncbi:hypothetical protein VHA01S_056_00050 [Vibrio halioticoli NBRC 102217]|uniref:diguanylate cyclase n=1 Tax=Vibrio halioticoli NBRC 102217 TaxID=1219072 RepID=V5FGA7_9VIBR|nr:diguanylate cyclase [Vibrio halioticoli]GAD90788.1 hypothetical protein VHA01S_056_00050 [Vibrio halioticoli NBRC 102217]